MSTETKIQWTDHTFNPWIGCAKVSAGCKHCYAEVSTPARTSKAKGLPLWGVGAHRQRTSTANWKLPIKWDRDAAKAGVRRRVFCASLADVFEDREDLDATRADLFNLIRRTPNLDWQILTKRPEAVLRILRRVGVATDNVDVARMMAQWCGGDPPANVWLGTTVEDQQRADDRIPKLLATPAAVRFLSCEPLLGFVDITDIVRRRGSDAEEHTSSFADPDDETPVGVDWVIVGGESGNGVRRCDLMWIRSVIAQCAAAGVACFVKQVGTEPTSSCDGSPMHDLVSIKNKKGGDMAEWPADLRVREFPKGGAA